MLAFLFVVCRMSVCCKISYIFKCTFIYFARTFRYNNFIGFTIATIVTSGGQRIADPFDWFEYRSDSSIILWWSITGNKSVYHTWRYGCKCWTDLNEQVILLSTHYIRYIRTIGVSKSSINYCYHFFSSVNFYH